MENFMIAGKIRQYMRENKITAAEFCSRAKISYNVYRKIMTNKTNYRIVALFRIAKVLNVEVWELFS